MSKSGGGKSTIFKLLYGYNIPTAGKIYLIGQDISQVSIKSLQKNIGLIGQNPNLFNGSVRDNIRYGAEDPDSVTDEQIWEMAKKTHLLEFLQSLDRGYHFELMPNKPTAADLTETQIVLYLKNNQPMYAVKQKDKIIAQSIGVSTLADYFRDLLLEYPFPIIDKDNKDELLDLLLTRNHIVEKRLDNPVGEDGKALSGGEQQRVAILRGLFKPGSIRLFDEITSALDSITADKLSEGIREITHDQTKLFITHKLAESQFADKIFVIHQGTVIAQGSYTQLLQTCSLYQELWEKQNKSEQKSENTTFSTAHIFKKADMVISELEYKEPSQNIAEPLPTPVLTSINNNSEAEQGNSIFSINKPA